MKFNCGPSREERRQAKMEWHRWFAWRPVRVDDDDCRWLEFVERKCTSWWGFGANVWEYRAL